MIRSLRRTLAARFAATMAAGLIAASAALCWGTARVLRQQLDQALAAAAYLAEEGFGGADPAGRGPRMAADRITYTREVNRYIVLRDRDGRVLHALPFYAQDLPFDSATLRRANSGERVWADVAWRGAPFRSVSYRVTHAGADGDVVLQVAASLRPLRQVQRDLIIVLLAVVLVGTGATLLGAGRLAGSAVRPVAEITEQATRIEAGTLDQRIIAHAQTDEYRDLVAVLNRMLERLEQGFHAQRRLTADVSHELRTPLTALRGEIEVALRAERSPRDYQRVLVSALEEIERLTRMSEDLLFITRVDSRLVTPRRAPTDVNAVLDRAIHAVRHRLEEKELTVGRRLDPGVGRPTLDQALLERLVEHLLDNAVKFTPIGGRISVVSESVNGGARLTVEDSGPGIDPADLPHLFTPFYRVDTARTRGTGTGLGLALAAAVARLHGGTIRALAALGGGTRFEVELPGPSEN